MYHSIYVRVRVRIRAEVRVGVRVSRRFIVIIPVTWNMMLLSDPGVVWLRASRNESASEGIALLSPLHLGPARPSSPPPSPGGIIVPVLPVFDESISVALAWRTSITDDSRSLVVGSG